MKYEKIILANAFALTTVILWVLCTLFVAFLPDLSLNITKSWMHGLDISVMGTWDLDIMSIVIGGLTLTASAWAAGYILGWSLEIVSKK